MSSHSTDAPDAVRVLYSFPHKIGASRICHTAWHQVDGVSALGAEVIAFPGAVHRPLRDGVTVQPTLARGRARIPYRALGRRAFSLHDAIVARRLPSLVGRVDVVHTWPLGALRTLRVARRLGIPTVLERPNAHTRFAFEAVRDECRRIGVDLPRRHEHAYKPDVLEIEEAEYQLADRLLCPSEFVAQTFVDQGFARAKLARHQYGYDPAVYYPAKERATDAGGLQMIFVGVCAVRKGLHFALEAWLSSRASETGTFSIVGEFLPSYERKLRPMLGHRSVRVLGHRNDAAELMRQSDVFVLPSIEEGYPLSTAEARGSGCVPLVSEACCEPCRHMVNGLIHRVGDVATLTQQINALDEDRALLRRLRESSLATVSELTWETAAEKLLAVYEDVAHSSPSAASGRSAATARELVRSA